MKNDDLISRAAAIDALTDRNIARNFDNVCDGEIHQTKRAAIRIMANLPAEDAATVVYGEWKWTHGGECSECGFHNSNFDYLYCPMCGAKMDGGPDA